MVPSRFRRPILWGTLVVVVVVACIGGWQWKARKTPAPRRAKVAGGERNVAPAIKVAPAAPTPSPAPPVDLEAELRVLALRDPMRAMQLAREGLDGPALEQTFLFALGKLAAVDLQGAAAFVRTMPSDKLQLVATEEIARLYFGLGSVPALSWVNLLPPGSLEQQRALNQVVVLWAEQDRGAAMRYVESLPPGALQDGAVARIAAVIGAADPSQALAWAQTLASPSARWAALQWLSDSSFPDPAGVARRLAAQPVEAAPALALHAALAGWLGRDSAAALLFVRTLPWERQMDAMLFVAPLAARQNPLQAIEWADKFSPRMRELARTAVLNQWIEQDPVAAQAWMNQRLSAPQRAAILQGRK